MYPLPGNRSDATRRAGCAGAAGNQMDHNVEEQLQTKQFIQYQLNKEDLETVLGSLIEKVIARYEAEKREPRLTIKQVSQRLNVDPSTLWRWERDGYLIPTRLGRKVLYNESDIIAIEEGRV